MQNMGMPQEDQAEKDSPWSRNTPAKEKFSCIVITNHTYTYTCRNIFNTIMTSEDTSLEKYTSHFIWKGSKGLLKVLLCERWVGGWTELQHIDHHSYGHNSVSFPFSWSAQPEAWEPSLSGICSSFQHLLSNCNCWVLVLSTASLLQLIELPVHRVI